MKDMPVSRFAGTLQRSAPRRPSARGRADKDWWNGTLLIAAIAGAPIVLVAIVRLFQA